MFDTFVSKKAGLVLGVFSLILMLMVLYHPGAFDWEMGVYRLLQKSSFLSWFWLVVSAAYPLAALLTFITLWNFWKASKKDEIILVILILSGALLTKVLKKIIKRPCPPDEIISAWPTFSSWFNQKTGLEVFDLKSSADYCWPSGHVTAYTILFGGVILLIISRLLPPHLRQTRLLWLSLILVVLIGPSRLFLGQHLFLDIAGGYAIGLLWLWLVFNWFRQKNR